MKRLLLVVSLVLLFSLTASAKKTPSVTYNFQFLTVNGDPYCDGMVLRNYGTPQTLVDGYHYDIWCSIENGDGEFTFNVNGFLASVDSSYQYGGSGNVMIVADPTAGWDGCFNQFPGHSTGLIPCPLDTLPTDVYLINPVTNTWTLWVSGGGEGEYVVNWGTIQPSVGPLVKAHPSQYQPHNLPRSSLSR